MPKYPVDASSSNFALPGPPDRALRQLGPVVHGRARELAALREVLARDGLALLCGPPGTGKTTLALRLAHSVADRFPDGQLRADLAALGMDDALAGFIRALTGPVWTRPRVWRNDQSMDRSWSRPRVRPASSAR